MSRQRLLAMLVLALGAGCSEPASDDAMQPATKQGPSGAECPSGSTLTYQSFASEFFGSYCVRCHSSEVEGTSRHGAPRSLNYETVEGIMAVPAERIDMVAAAGPSQYNAFMPPSDPRPSRGEREQLGEWLACGRP